MYVTEHLFCPIFYSLFTKYSSIIVNNLLNSIKNHKISSIFTHTKPTKNRPLRSGPLLLYFLKNFTWPLRFGTRYWSGLSSATFTVNTRSLPWATTIREISVTFPVYSFRSAKGRKWS